MIAEVIINRTAKKLNRTFDYMIPKDLEDLIMIGSKVLVPFGKGGKLEQAFVVAIKDNSDYEVKEIAKIEDNLTDRQIELARWMSKRYFCNVSDCIKFMLTPGTRTKINKVQDKTVNAVYLKKDIEEIEFDIETNKIKSEKHKKVIKFVRDNEGVTIPEIEMLIDCSRAIVNTLVKNGYLEIVPKKVEREPLKDKDLERTSNLKLTEEQEMAYELIESSIDEEIYKSFLLYGVTGSRKNRSVFAINPKSNWNRQNSNSVSARDIFNTTNVGQIYFKVWKRENSCIT